MSGARRHGLAWEAEGALAFVGTRAAENVLRYLSARKARKHPAPR